MGVMGAMGGRSLARLTWLDGRVWMDSASEWIVVNEIQVVDDTHLPLLLCCSSACLLYVLDKVIAGMHEDAGRVHTVARVVNAEACCIIHAISSFFFVTCLFPCRVCMVLRA